MSETAPEAPAAQPTPPSPAQPNPGAPAPSTPATPAPPADPAAAETPKTFSQDDVNSLLAKQRREQFGDYSDLKRAADELAALKESQKSEQERAADAARKAQEEALAARADVLRYKAAATHGIGEDYFDLLGSGDEEAINGRAERVGALIKTNADLTAENTQLKAEVEALRAGRPTPSAGRPTEALRPGAVPTEPSQVADDAYPSHWLPARNQ